jgi:hypothetical protein
MKYYSLQLLLFVVMSFPAFGQSAPPISGLKALGAPNNPKVEVAWNRYYDWKGVTEIVQRLAAAYPNLCTLESIGKSYEGRDLWAVTITNRETGNDAEKPAMYIDAAIHANEIQAVEVALYTAWYLLETYSTNSFVKELVDTRTFYIIPGESPDSRDKFMHSANTPHSPRSGQVPRDDDGDGLINEDGPDDLNGDGHITQMRIKTPGGRWKISPDDNRLMIPCKPDEVGDYEVFQTEGFDNDGDGLINEDGDGSYDPNRNWAWNWQPNYKQYGADYYPFSLPETRIISQFIAAHPNIIGGQSFHNAGGMILRGPGAKEDVIEPNDGELFDLLGKKGEELLPGYRFMITWKDLYSVYGGENDWMYATQGILPFTNELWTPFNMFRQKPDKDNWFGETEQQYLFDKTLLFGDAIVPWQEVDHPQLGKIEVGGVKKTFTRMPPSFLLEEECHRNMAFLFWHAYNLPKLKVLDIKTKPLGADITEVTATILNERSIPTRLSVDVKNNISRPDWITLKGGTAITGGIRNSRYDKTFTEQKSRPQRLEVPSIQGSSTVTVTWIAKGTGPFSVDVDSQKGGKIKAAAK